MKKTLLIASMLLAGSAAANDVTINLQGELAPTSCSLALTRGTVELGNIPTSELTDGHIVSWAANQAPQVNITCNGDVLVAFSLTDNRSDTLENTAGVAEFGIGRFDNTDNNGNSIGSMKLSLANVEVETVLGLVAAPGNLIRFDNEFNAPAEAATESALRKSSGTDSRYSYEAIRDGGARRLAFDLMGTLTLADIDQIDAEFMTTAHTIDGNFTVTAHF